MVNFPGRILVGSLFLRRISVKGQLSRPRYNQIDIVVSWSAQFSPSLVTKLLVVGPKGRDEEF